MLRPGAVRLCSRVGFPLVLPTAPILPLFILGCSSCPFLIPCFAASPGDGLYLATEPGKAGAKPLHGPVGTARGCAESRGRIRAGSECLGLCLNPLRAFNRRRARSSLLSALLLPPQGDQTAKLRPRR